jgi:hypothetical protein
LEWISLAQDTDKLRDIERYAMKRLVL